jgi:Flp pilus assembly protein CpaB
MKLRITLLILAIIIGAAAVFGVIAYINSMKASMEEEIEKVEVLVAAMNIPKEMPVKTLIEQNMVATEGIPRRYLAESVLNSLEGYRGYVVANHINKGEQITTTKFAKPEDLGLAFVIPDGMVAVSIPVDEVIGVSNLINMGDRVNVIATFFPEEELSGYTGEVTSESEGQIEGGEEHTVIEGENAGSYGEPSVVIEKEITKTLLWNVEVLYLGTRKTVSGSSGEDGGIFGAQPQSESRSTEINTATLAVTPEDSEKLVFSEEMGSVWLALVPVDGVEKEDTTGITMDNIFN